MGSVIPFPVATLVVRHLTARSKLARGALDVVRWARQRPRGWSSNVESMKQHRIPLGESAITIRNSNRTILQLVLQILKRFKTLELDHVSKSRRINYKNSYEISTIGISDPVSHFPNLKIFNNTHFSVTLHLLFYRGSQPPQPKYSNLFNLQVIFMENPSFSLC